jgi:hypothetical protein
MEKQKTELDIYCEIKDDRMKKDFYKDFNDEELKFLSSIKLEELLK